MIWTEQCCDHVSDNRTLWWMIMSCDDENVDALLWKCSLMKRVGVEAVIMCSCLMGWKLVFSMVTRLTPYCKLHFDSDIIHCVAVHERTHGSDTSAPHSPVWSCRAEQASVVWFGTFNMEKKIRRKVLLSPRIRDAKLSKFRAMIYSGKVLHQNLNIARWKF